MKLVVEKWKNILYKGESASVIFMDFSKTFDTINHELLLPKLHKYGFSGKALKLM